MRGLTAALVVLVAAAVAPAQTVQVVDPYSLYPVRQRDGGLWVAATAADGTKVGNDATTWLAAYKRPGGAVTALPFPGAVYSAATAVGNAGQVIGGQAYTGWYATDSSAVRWNLAAGTRESVTYAQALPFARRPEFTYLCGVEGIADDGAAVVWMGADNRAVWRPDGTLAAFPDLSGVIGPDWYVYTVFSVQVDGPGTYTVRLVAVHPTLPYTGFVISGLRL